MLDALISYSILRFIVKLRSRSRSRSEMMLRKV